MSVNSKNSGRAVGTVAIMMGATVIAKLLGMLRGVLQAGAYGTSDLANAFTAASKLPLAFFDMFLAAAVLGCFIPVYNSFKAHDTDRSTDAEADDFACIFLNFIIILCGVLALAGIVFAKPLILIITQGLSRETQALAITLTRIMFPLVIFTGAAYTLVGVLQSKGSFIIPALISAVSNAGVVLYLAVFNAPLGDKGIYGLAFAYLFSWLIQLLTLIVPLWKRGFRYKLLLDIKNPALIRALKMAPPIMIGSWLAPLGILIGQYFAAKVSAVSGISGATTVFDYANNIYVIIAGVLTYSICNYTFPKISRLAADKNREEFARVIRRGLLSALFIVLPIMAAALVLAPEGTAVLYMRGAFSGQDAYNTAKALRFIIPAMPWFCAVELLSRVFYSLERPRVPMLAALCGIGANLISGFVLTKLEAFDIGAVGAANAIGQIAAAVVLIIFAARCIDGLFTRGFVIELIKIVLGSAAVFAGCMLMAHLVSSQAFAASFMTNLLNMAVIFLPCAVLYLLFAKLVRIRFDI